MKESKRRTFLFGLTVINVLVAALSVRAETPYAVTWSRQTGGVNLDEGRAVAVDGSGNAYISGLASTLAGGNAFLTKYDSAGTLLWSQQVLTGTHSESWSVAVDGSGSAYISGSGRGNVAGPSAGNDDAFLIKYDSAGTLLWSRQIGSTITDDGRSVAVDSSGNAYISGYTRGNLAGPNAGSSDAFLAKYDSTGDLLWSRQIGTSTNDLSFSVAADASGGAYITGGTRGSLGGPNAGDFDAFLTKYDSAGAMLWSRQIGTIADDVSYSVIVDGSGNAFISGYTSGSLGGASAGNFDAFLTKYDSAGTLLWSRQLGTSSDDWSFSVDVDGSGNAYIGGRTRGSLGGPSAGDNDAYLAKYDSAGSLLWSRQIGTSSSDGGVSAAVDGFGNAYLTGWTGGSLGGPSAGDFDAFLVKFSPVPEVPEPPALVLLGIGACGLAAVRRRSTQRSGAAAGTKHTPYSESS